MNFLEEVMREKLEEALKVRGAELRSRQLDALVEVLAGMFEDLLDVRINHTMGKKYWVAR